MKYVLIFLVAVLINDPVKISKINTAKKEAKNAFNSGDYKTAISKYRYLIDSLGVKEEEVTLNLANAYYLEKDTANAFNNYQSLTGSVKRDINSKAHQQLGLMANTQGKSEEALNYFKQALKADPSNEDARYNYEMLKKKLDEKKKQQQQQDQNKDQKDQKKDQQNKDQQNKDKKDQKDQQNKEQQKKEDEKKDQQNKDQKKDQQQKDQQKKDQQQKDKEQQEKEEKEKQDQQKQEEQEQKDKQEQAKKDNNLDRDKLEQMKISEEKARMILEAMKNQEKQYLQQQKRKATKSKDKGKPDW